MNEAETRAELIDPALKERGWGVIEDTKILREYYFTAGNYKDNVIEWIVFLNSLLLKKFVLIFRMYLTYCKYTEHETSGNMIGEVLLGRIFCQRNKKGHIFLNI